MKSIGRHHQTATHIVGSLREQGNEIGEVLSDLESLVAALKAAGNEGPTLEAARRTRELAVEFRFALIVCADRGDALVSALDVLSRPTP